MGGDFFHNTISANAANADRAAESANERVTLQDIHESLEGLRAIGAELLIHVREMTGLQVEDPYHDSH